MSFRWTDCTIIIETITLAHQGLRLVIVGDVEAACYEWLLTRGQRVVDHSDDAWLRAEDAKAAGLAAANDDSPDDAEALRLAIEIIERVRRAA